MANTARSEGGGRGSDAVAYIIAIVLGLAAGYVNLEVNDPTLAAVLVAMVAMGLGLWKPRRAWRWGLVVGLCVPAAQLLAYAKGVPPLRGQVARAFFIGVVSATVAALLGSAGRFAFAHIAPPKQGTENREEETEQPHDNSR